jgi:hypothetical protein
MWGTRIYGATGVEAGVTFHPRSSTFIAGFAAPAGIAIEIVFVSPGNSET